MLIAHFISFHFIPISFLPRYSRLGKAPAGAAGAFSDSLLPEEGKHDQNNPKHDQNNPKHDQNNPKPGCCAHTGPVSQQCHFPFSPCDLTPEILQDNNPSMPSHGLFFLTEVDNKFSSGFTIPGACTHPDRDAGGRSYKVWGKKINPKITPKPG